MVSCRNMIKCSPYLLCAVNFEIFSDLIFNDQHFGHAMVVSVSSIKDNSHYITFCKMIFPIVSYAYVLPESWTFANIPLDRVFKGMSWSDNEISSYSSYRPNSDLPETNLYFPNNSLDDLWGLLVGIRTPSGRHFNFSYVSDDPLPPYSERDLRLGFYHEFNYLNGTSSVSNRVANRCCILNSKSYLMNNYDNFNKGYFSLSIDRSSFQFDINDSDDLNFYKFNRFGKHFDWYGFSINMKFRFEFIEPYAKYVTPPYSKGGDQYYTWYEAVVDSGYSISFYLDSFSRSGKLLQSVKILMVHSHNIYPIVYIDRVYDADSGLDLDSQLMNIQIELKNDFDYHMNSVFSLIGDADFALKRDIYSPISSIVSIINSFYSPFYHALNHVNGSGGFSPLQYLSESHFKYDIFEHPNPFLESLINPYLEVV